MSLSTWITHNKHFQEEKNTTETTRILREESASTPFYWASGLSSYILVGYKLYRRSSAEDPRPSETSWCKSATSNTPIAGAGLPKMRRSYKNAAGLPRMAQHHPAPPRMFALNRPTSVADKVTKLWTSGSRSAQKTATCGTRAMERKTHTNLCTCMT